MNLYCKKAFIPKYFDYVGFSTQNVSLFSTQPHQLKKKKIIYEKVHVLREDKRHLELFWDENNQHTHKKEKEMFDRTALPLDKN